MVLHPGECLPGLPIIQVKEHRQPARHGPGQFAVVNRQPGQCLAMHQPHLQQPPQPSRDEILRVAERQPIVQHARANHPRDHVHARTAQVGDGDFQGIAVQEQPRRLRKTLSQQWQFTDVPGVELDHQSLLHASATLPIGRHQTLERHPAFGGGQITAQQSVQRRRFGDDDVVIQLYKHLADQCRTAAGGMEDERTGCQARALLLPLAESAQGRLATEHLVERQAQGVFYGFVEERLRQRCITEPAPIDPPLPGLSPDADRQPAIQVQTFHWSRHCRRPLRIAARIASSVKCRPCSTPSAMALSMKASRSCRLCNVRASCGSVSTHR